MRAQLLRHLAIALVVFIVIIVLAAIGSPGATYRANSSFAGCVTDTPSGTETEAVTRINECKAAHCPDSEPSRVASLGLWLHGQLDPEAPACHEPPELLGVILP